ncbi:MAG: hypothetical protein GY786_03690 [Proteobacteria bacterium]|nr:hypothetical protein [Pseudomonadota bacterium]
MVSRSRKFLLFLLLFIAFLPNLGIAEHFEWTPKSWAPERREQKSKNEFGWLVAPTPIIIPGIGTAFPLMSILTNVYESTDLMVAQTIPGGDFDLQFQMVDQLPLFTDHVLFTYGQWNNKIPSQWYNRGIDSNKDDFLQPVSESTGRFAQLRFTFWRERVEVFTWGMSNSGKMVELYDADGNEISEFDDSETTSTAYFIGGILDFTDDRTDPRKGFRIGYRGQPVNNDSKYNSDFIVQDFNFTYYLPIKESDTLVFNAFRSMATVTNKATATLAELTTKVCNSPSCAPALETRLQDNIAANKYGTASSIGGTNRMRAFPVGRFSAGNSATYGVEYRKNFSTKETPVNWYLLGGIKTSLQLAFFAEYGTVNDDAAELTSNLKSSYGVGLRSIISGLVYRFDLAVGEEGVAPALFIFYPWDLNPAAG